MRFLIRSTFWLSMVLLAVPFGGGGEEAVSPLQALGAAREAVGDVAGICERKPEVCETGRQAVRTIAVRAGEMSRVALDIMEETPAPQDDIGALIAEEAGAAPHSPETTASIPQPRPAHHGD